MRKAAVLVTVIVLAACSRNSFDYLFARGDRALAARRYPEALIDFTSAARLAPQSSTAQTKMGDIYTALHQPAQAAAAYDRACSLDNRNVAACVAAASQFLAIGDYDRAASEARVALEADHLNLDAQLILGSALGGSRRFAEAEERIQAAVALVPQDPRPYRALADLFRRRGDDVRAEALLRKAIDVDPASPDARVSLGELYLERGRQADGERQLLAALAAKPDDLEANRSYASYLVDADRCTDAEPYWKKVAAHSPDASGTLALADFYVWSGRPDDALRVLNPLTEGRDEGAAARTRVASILYDRGDRDKAAQMVDTLLTTDQSNVNGLVLRARIALDRGEPAEAREYAHKAAALAPNAPAVRQVLAATSTP